MSVAEAVGDDMLRLRVESTLQSIQAEEGYAEPIARIVFVQLARQAATRIGLRKWKSRTQSEQEAGEESLKRFLDGTWEYRGGQRVFSNSNANWVLHIWEVACEEWVREEKKPKQLAIVAPPAKLSDRLRDAYITHNGDEIVKVIDELVRREL